MNREEYSIENGKELKQEILLLSTNDIELILEDQLDLYSDDEIALLRERLSALYAEERVSQERETVPKKKNIPPVIKCPKCDGENPSANQQCQYCSYTFKEKDYIIQSKTGDMCSGKDRDIDDNRSLYVIAFLLPIIGVIMGLIYIAKDKEALGKSLMIFSIVSTIIITLIGLGVSGAFGSIFSNLGSKTCHNCGEVIHEEAVEAGGRYYCSYDCYMQEVLFD